jgi:hypothetical protein
MSGFGMLHQHPSTPPDWNHDSGRGPPQLPMHHHSRATLNPTPMCLIVS